MKHVSKVDTQRRRSPANRSAFGREWLRSPARLGAVAPSGADLAAAITDGLSRAQAPVLELGPGTGVFTSALLARGIPPNQIAAIEKGERFAETMLALFPKTKVIQGDASNVTRLTPFGPAAAGSIVCGLPLLTMPPSKVYRILEGSFASLKPGGTFRLFTYILRCPVQNGILDRLGISVKRTAFVLRNIPPASVYVLRRRGQPDD